MTDPRLGNIHLQLRAGLVVRPPLELAPPLYWRLAVPDEAPAAQLSTRDVISGDMATAAGTLSLTKGSASSNPTFNFPGSGTAPSLSDTTTGALPGKIFVSNPLAAQTIPAQLWQMAAAGQSGYAGPVVGFSLALYAWRPSDDSLVGMIYDGTGIIGSTLASNATTGAVGQFSGDGVGVLDGDVLVLEVYQAVQAGAYFAAGVAVYDGPNAIVDSSISANGNAAFIRPTTALTFQ